MGQLLSLNILILNAGRPGSEDELRQRWHEWASRGPQVRLSFISALESERELAWKEVISHMSPRMNGDPLLIASPHLRPNGNLLETLGKILERKEYGWWFSVKPLSFYLHNVLMKEGTLVRNFEMEGVFSMDHERLMFFNHVTGSHFLHSQDAPCILTNDRGLCFINPHRFDDATPLPYEFGEADYVMDRGGMET